MDDEGIEDLEVLAVEVGKVRSACVLLQVVAEVLETGGAGDKVRLMELHEGLGFFLIAIAEKLREVQARLSQD